MEQLNEPKVKCSKCESTKWIFVQENENAGWVCRNCYEVRLNDLKLELGKVYESIIEQLNKYTDLPKEAYSIIPLWIIGTYFHSSFETFPLLFFNATKGSGKSRLCKLCSSMAKNGKIVIDMKEAVLFRTAKNHTLVIDEFEGVGSKDNMTLRTLINASYKKGVAVERMKKVQSKEGKGEEHVVERFDLYTPVIMANIWGMEDVLADRCIQIVIDKSDKQIITKLIEDFENNPEILKIKSSLNNISVVWCSVVTEKNIAKAWNSYVLERYRDTLTTLYTYTTQTTQTTLSQEDFDTFRQIDETKIDGRNLELFFPLFMMARLINEDVFKNFLKIAKDKVSEKKHEEYAESKDVTLVDFISKKDIWLGSWKSIHDITVEFKATTSEDPEGEKWLNDKWFGRALKRMKLISRKRRVGKGIEVMLDITKAKEQLRRYKEIIEEEKE
jgi:hypothetical protein